MGNKYVIKTKEEQLRIDKILTKFYPTASRSTIQKWIKNGDVTVNEEMVKPNYKCKLFDEIKVIIPETKPISIEKENIPLSIIYEDDSIIVINKPKGMVVYPTKAHMKGTLVNALLHYTNNLSTIGGKERPGIVHRLDKDTSGLLLIAKDNKSHRILKKDFEENKVDRVYEAIVEGTIEHDTGLIDAPIGRDKKNRLRMTVTDQGKQAKTHFQVLQRFKSHTYVSCQLETGRMHQIRVHFNYIDHPIIGDEKYNGVNGNELSSQVLYAKKLTFKHPVTKMTMTFEIDPPELFQKCLTKFISNT